MTTPTGDPVHLDGSNEGEGEPSWPPKPVIKPGTVFRKAPPPPRQMRQLPNQKMILATDEEDLSHVCEFVEGPPPARGHKKSPIWAYYSHLDLDVHPDMKQWRLCKICRHKGVDKALNVTANSSTGSLIEHLRRKHPGEFKLYLKAKEEKMIATGKEEGVPLQGQVGMHATGVGKKRKASQLKFETTKSKKAPLLQIAENMPVPKTQAERSQEELMRLLKIQRLVEERLDNLTARLEQGREKKSPFDVALLQDRKESAVKNVQAVAKKIDGIFDKLH